MLRAASKYGMQETLRQCIINDLFGSTQSRKEMTKRAVWDYEKQCWQATCLMYPELEVYRKYVHDIRMNAWWKFCSNHPEMTKKASYCMALHLGAQPKGMQRNIDKSKFKCGLCTLRVNENFKHILFECNEQEETNQIAWRKVLIKHASRHENKHPIWSNAEWACAWSSGILFRRCLHHRVGRDLHDLARLCLQDVYQEIQYVWCSAGQHRIILRLLKYWGFYETRGSCI